MSTSTSNTYLAPDLVTLIHQYYAIGAEIVKIAVNEGISNATVNSVCAAVKTDRGSLVNTFHTTILTNLAGQ